MALDPKRFRVGVSGQIASLFVRLAPRPDLLLCLHADAAVILNRKQELPMEEIERQLNAIRAFASKEPRAVLVSTEGTVDEARDRVLDVICDFLGRRLVMNFKSDSWSRVTTGSRIGERQ